jgi:hypothetical protein
LTSSTPPGPQQFGDHSNRPGARRSTDDHVGRQEPLGIAGVVGRLLAWAGRTPGQRTGMTADLTHRPDVPPTGMDLSTWLRSHGERGRMPSPTQVREHFPRADPTWLVAYQRDYAAFRRLRIRGRHTMAAAYAGRGGLCVYGQSRRRSKGR